MHLDDLSPTWYTLMRNQSARKSRVENTSNGRILWRGNLFAIVLPFALWCKKVESEVDINILLPSL
jgi:hypothetical protein